MTQRSRYDELHDKYHSIISTKAGTRYERLAAIVFKILEEHNVVIHDLKLIGNSDVKHQIDVNIEKDGKSRRIVVECKDFSISQEFVGLDILRSFRSVIEDTNADEGIVLTCNGYSSDARKYAKAKNIKLAVLREIQDEDLEGLIRSVIVNIHIEWAKNHSVAFDMSEENRELYESEAKRLGTMDDVSNSDPVYFVRGTDRVQLTDFISAQARDNQATRTPTDRFQMRMPSDGWALQFGDGPLISFNIIAVTFDMESPVVPLTITSNRIAELVLTSLGDDDIIIFGDDIERRKINPDTGEIS